MTQPSGDYLSSSNPYNYDQPLPPLARTNAVTQVPPAKKITFYKSGDPQFGGVKMAINQRSFKSFNALMDDLSHRVPLPFGVRTITTPRGIHCISTLDQLEDGGCYLCSDKKYVTPIGIGVANRRTGPQKTGRLASALRRSAQQDGKHDDYSTGVTQQSPRIPKKVTLVKNGDITTQRPIIINRRNARSLKTLLDEISEVMQFTVKKLFTLDGRKIDSMQALLHCPNVLVCVGREPFKPMVKDNSRRHSSEKLPGLTSRSSNNGENQEMNFGLEAKKSVMHPRSSLSNRSARFSLSSEKSSTNGLAMSPENGAPFSHNCPHAKAGDLAHSLVNDDIEKSVHVNKDGSLSVEMKVRFRLLNDETLQWSTQIRKSSLMNTLPCEELSVSHDNGLEPIENPEASSELDDSLYPCDVDSYMSNLDESENDEARCHKCGKPCKDYDIWKNPMHASQKEEPAVKSTWYTHSSCSSTSSHRRIIRKKVASVDSIRTSSSGEEYSKHVVRESSHYSETVENMVEYHSVKNRCCQHGCGQTNPSQRGSPEEMDAIPNSANSQNEEETTVEGGGGGGKSKGSRTGSSKSKSSQVSAESQIRVCEETSSLARTISSGSIKERGEVEDVVVASSSPNSIHSKSSKGSIVGGATENADEVSENDQVVSSFSMDSCPKKDAAEEETEKEDEEINEIYSVSENSASNLCGKDEVTESGRSSTARSFGSESCAGNNQRSDSDEIHMCSAASASSRSSKRSKHSQNHLEVASNRSVGSSRGSTSSKKKKRSKSSLHAEDARSSSKASHYSRSSCEVKKRDSEGQESQGSSPPPSLVSSLSEGAVPPANNEESTSSISKCYSKSSKNSQKENQADDSSKISSPCSSFSDSGGKNGNGVPKVSSPEDSSKLGGMSESTCSKCGHVMKSCRDDLRSVSSKVSSYSEGRSRYAEMEASRRSDDACSQSSVALSSKSRGKRTSSLHADVERSSQVSASESASMYSLRCPAPPKGRPSGRKSRTMLLKKSSKGSNARTESEVIAVKEKKEATTSQSPETEVAHGEGNVSEPLNTEKGSCQEKVQEEIEIEASALDGSDGVIPSSLPNASPEEVVHEWLRKIPSDTLLMKCEMQDDGEDAEVGAEILGCSNSQELLEEEAEEKKEDSKEAESPADAAEAAAEGTKEELADEQPKEDLNEEKTSEAVLEETEAGEEKGDYSLRSGQNNHKKDLPNTIQTSVQIMKALLASKQEPTLDRSHSLPEVSPTMGRKLSNSANILITCLASLQLLDEELDPSSKSNKDLNRPRYTELLNIFQALWCGCASEKGGPSSGVEEEGQAKVPSGFKGHCSKEDDFTPMSSSGVDVSSGDGGSGEGSVAGGRERALSQEKTEEVKPSEEEAKNTEVEADNEDDQGDISQAPMSHSQSEGGEKVDSAGGEEAAEAKEDKDDDCETGQEHEKEIAEEAEEEEIGEQENENVECEEVNADGDALQVETQEDSIVNEGEDIPSQENAEKVTEEPSNHEATEEPSNQEETEEPSHNDPGTKEDNGMEESEINGAKQLVGTSETDTQPSSNIVLQPSMKVSAVVQQKSIDPDPVWVLKLLKKIEKEFMTHYVSAMNEFKVKWNLPNTDEVNLMISELKEEVSQRIQKIIDKELKKIRSRAGRRIPRPPNEELRRESTLQVENRRRRLQSIRKMSLYNDRNTNQSNQKETRKLSYEIDEDFLFSSIRDDDSELPSEEDYCPCDACIRKKMEARAIRGPVIPPVAANAPITKAFDLQQILKMKKGSVHEKMVEPNMAEMGQGGEAEGDTAEPEANQETEPVEEKEVGETNEKEEEEEQEVKEAEAEALSGGEEASENQNCEEAGEGEVADEEAEEEAKQEVGEGEEDEGGKEEVEEEVMEAEENEEEVGEKEEEKEEEDAKEEEEEVDVKIEGEEEEQEVKEDEVEFLPDREEVSENQNCEVAEGEEATNEEQEEGAEEEVGEEEEDEERKEEVEEEVGEEEEKEEEEGAQEEEKEKEDTKEEEEVDEKEEEEVEAGEGEEESVKEENEGEEVEEKGATKEEEKEEEVSVKEEEEEKETVEEEEEAGEEKEENSVKEEEEEREEKEEGSVKEEAEEDAIEGKEEGMDEEEQGGGEEAHDEIEEEKEEKSVKEEEEEKEEREEEEEEGDELAENDNQEVEDKSEVEIEENEEEEKNVNEEQEEETEKEDQEAEEEPKMEDDGAAEQPEAGEGESQKDESECVENGDAGGSEAEAAGEENEIVEDTQAGGGEEIEENDAKPEEEGEVCSETAEVEEEGGNKESDHEAGEKEEEAEGEESNEPGQADGDEEDPAGTGDKEEDDCEEPSETIKNLRKASAISSMANCSQQSQKGSEDGNDGEDCKEDDDMDRDDEGAKSDTENKPATMYPDIEEEEEEEEDRASSPASGGKEEPKTDENEEDNTQVSKKKEKNSEAIDQDDLDF